MADISTYETTECPHCKGSGTMDCPKSKISACAPHCNICQGQPGIKCGVCGGAGAVLDYDIGRTFHVTIEEEPVRVTVDNEPLNVTVVNTG